MDIGNIPQFLHSGRYTLVSRRTFKTLLRARNGREMGRDGYLEADLDLDDFVTARERDAANYARGVAVA